MSVCLFVRLSVNGCRQPRVAAGVVQQQQQRPPASASSRGQQGRGRHLTIPSPSCRGEETWCLVGLFETVLLPGHARGSRLPCGCGRGTLSRGQPGDRGIYICPWSSRCSWSALSFCSHRVPYKVKNAHRVPHKPRKSHTDDVAYRYRHQPAHTHHTLPTSRPPCK